MSILSCSMLLAALLTFFVSLTHGAEIAYCSPDNTGADTGYQPEYRQFNSDGFCQHKCQDGYAYAVLQGSECWCSNYGPSNQKQTNLCNEPCPGYPSDWCGSRSAGLYGYVALNVAPSGTIGVASWSPQASFPVASESVSTTLSTRRYHTPSSPSTTTSSAVEKIPASSAPITPLTSVVSAQSTVPAPSSTVPTSPAVVDPASSTIISSTIAQSSTLVTSPSASPTPSLSPSPDPSPDPSPSPSPSLSPSPTPSTTPVATEAVTIVTTVTGKVTTIISTSSATAVSTLGHGPASRNGLSKGTVVGVVIGVALGIGLVIGLIVWFCLRHKLASNSAGSSSRFGATFGVDRTPPSQSGFPSRQVSQMSSAGLLAGKGARIQTTGYGMSNGPGSAEASSGASNDRRSVGTDQRLNHYALFGPDQARQSNISLQDNQDYSRPLRVANPDP